jgi:beta-glucosidase
MPRKLLSFCLIFILCVTLFPAASSATETNELNLVSDNRSLHVDDTLIISIEGKQITDLFASEIDLTFDPHILEYKNVISGSPNSIRILQGNTIELAKTSMTASGDTELYRLEFKAKAPGTVVLTLTNVELQSSADAHNRTSQKRYIGRNTVVEVLGRDHSTPPPTVQVTGVSLNPGTMSLPAGATGQLNATVSPSNAANNNVTWLSSNPAVASVDANGKVTAVAAGTATITVTSVDGGKTATCTVTVTPSGGGANTPNPTPAPSPAPTLKPSAPFVKVDATTDEIGVATAIVKAEDFQSAIDHAKGHIVKIEVNSAVGAKEVKVLIPIGQVQSAKDNQIHVIEVDTGLATISINPDLLMKNDEASSGNLVLSVAKVDASALPAYVQEQLGNQTVYDFNLSVDGKRINKFDGNDVSVAIPYTLKPGENPNKVVIYYISDGGKLEVIKNGKYNPETGKVEFKPMHFSKYSAVHSTVAFHDIAGMDWAKDAIEGLAAREAVNGVGNFSFNPGGNVTRSEFVTMLMRTFDLADSEGITTLTDVETGAWYYSSITSAQKLGIVLGKEDGSFGVHDKISREDMAVMIYRTARYLQAELGKSSKAVLFTDQSAISIYASEAVSALQQAGVIQGNDDGRFAPNEPSTRAQAATVVFRLYLAIK